MYNPYQRRVGAQHSGRRPQNTGNTYLRNAVRGGGGACPPGECGTPPPFYQGDCPSEGVNYCFTHIGGRVTNIAAGTPTPIVITPVNMIEYVPRWFVVVAFLTGTDTRLFNGNVVSVLIKGDDQLAGQPVPFMAWDPQVTVLEVNWRTITPQNPATITVQHFSAGNNADIEVGIAGDAIK